MTNTKLKNNNYNTLENYVYKESNNIIEGYLCPDNYSYDPNNFKSDINGCVKNVYTTTSTYLPKKEYVKVKPNRQRILKQSCCNLFI